MAATATMPGATASTACSRCAEMSARLQRSEKDLHDKIEEIAKLYQQIGAGNFVDAEKTRTVRFRLNPCYTKMLHDHVDELVEAGKSRDAIDRCLAEDQNIVNNMSYTRNYFSVAGGSSSSTSANIGPASTAAASASSLANSRSMPTTSPNPKRSYHAVDDAGRYHATKRVRMNVDNEQDAGDARGGTNQSEKHEAGRNERSDIDATRLGLEAESNSLTSNSGITKNEPLLVASLQATATSSSNDGSGFGGASSSSSAEITRKVEALDEKVLELHLELEAERKKTEKLKRAFQIQSERYRIGVEELLGWRLRMRANNVWQISSPYGGLADFGDLVVEQSSNHHPPRGAVVEQRNGDSGAVKTSSSNNVAQQVVEVNVLSKSSAAWMGLFEEYELTESRKTIRNDASEASFDDVTPDELLPKFLAFAATKRRSDMERGLLQLSGDG
ncbi:unnamed protein product [Amoebophrya sp. A25]|nr:unnamed protein product [Amoebophrya sp. A25]|eukprot:GSA25T00014337001.1